VPGSQALDLGFSNEVAGWQEWYRQGWIECSPGPAYTVKLYTMAKVWYYRPGGPATRWWSRGYYSFRTRGLTVLSAELHMPLHALVPESGKTMIDAWFYLGAGQIDAGSLGADGAEAEFWGRYNTYVGYIDGATAQSQTWYTFPVPTEAVNSAGYTDLMIMPSTVTASDQGGIYYFATAWQGGPGEPFLRLTIQPLRGAARTVDIVAAAQDVIGVAGEAAKALEAGAAEVVAAAAGRACSAVLARTTKRASASMPLLLPVEGGTDIRRGTLGTRIAALSQAAVVRRGESGTRTVATEAPGRDVEGQ